MSSVCSAVVMGGVVGFLLLLVVGWCGCWVFFFGGSVNLWWFL